MHMIRKTEVPIKGGPGGVGIYADKNDSNQVKIHNGSDTYEVVTDSGEQTLEDKHIVQPVTEYATDGAITIESGLVVLTKATAGAYTLAAPTAAQNGTRMDIISKTAAAHVITATNLINDGVGAGLDTITFDAVIGAHVQLVAYNLQWYVLSFDATVAIAGA